MKSFKPDTTRPRANLLALSCLMTSPEYGRWMMSRDKMPSLHSPQNIVRVLDTFTFHLSEISSGLDQAKKEVVKKDWREARGMIEKALAALDSFRPDGEDLLDLLKKGEHDHGAN